MSFFLTRHLDALKRKHFGNGVTAVEQGFNDAPE